MHNCKCITCGLKFIVECKFRFFNYELNILNYELIDH